MERFVQERSKFHQGQIGRIPNSRIFEGENNSIIRPDGAEEVNPMTTSSAELIVKGSELKDLDLNTLLQKLDYLAIDMAKQRSKITYSSLQNGIETVGNTIDASGKKLTPELLLQMLEKIFLDFRPDGVPILPTLHIHPSMKESVEQLLKAMDENPKYADCFNAIIAKKREEWNAREADRSLVG
jgi:hypothetical protein